MQCRRSRDRILKGIEVPDDFPRCQRRGAVVAGAAKGFERGAVPGQRKS